MKTINTLPEDIYGLLDRGVNYSPTPNYVAKMTENLAKHFTSALGVRTGTREKGKAWFSDLGEVCSRKIWYKWNSPHLGEKLLGNTSFKFLYGNILEEQVLYLAKEAGHKVEREQERVEIQHNGWTLSGRIDAIVDGTTIDVKSASTYSYNKFTTKGVTEETDSFGYRHQLSGYHNALDLPGNPAFIFIDKQNGHLNVVHIDPLPKESMYADLDNIRLVTEELEATAVPRGYDPVPDGKSGNLKLGTQCSYCTYKRECWPGLKGYAYSSGPTFLTNVVRVPNVSEIF